MKRPNKKDYDLNDHFEAIRLARDLIKYIDYLELEKQTNQEQKLHVDLVSYCEKPKRDKLVISQAEQGDFLISMKICPRTVNITVGKEYQVIEKNYRGLRVILDNGKKHWVGTGSRFGYWEIKL
jgi:hypothetical protein